MNRHLRPAVILAAALLLGCSDEPTLLQPVFDPTLAAIPRNPPDVSDRTSEMLSASLANRIPGFGGFSTDEQGNIILFLRDVNDAAAVDIVSSEVMFQRTATWRGRWGTMDAEAPQLIIRPARFTFLELQRWRDLLGPEVFKSGAVMLDLDEHNNRLTVGLDIAVAGMAAPAVEQMLSTLAIPTEAVHVVPMEPFVTEPAAEPLLTPESQVNHPDVSPTNRNLYIDDEYRPVVGGLKIVYQNRNNGVQYRCTIGMATQYHGGYYFLTASQ
jgi:hypothetical protein